MAIVSLEFALPDSGITERLGGALARSFADDAGAVLYLRGELGSGKTTCARSLLQTLGISARVRSPTYTLVDTYGVGQLTCAHVDLYRLRSENEVEELGLRDLTGPGFLMLVEWPDKGGVAVPAADLAVLLRYAGEGRVASVQAASRAGESWLSKLAIDSSLRGYVSNMT